MRTKVKSARLTPLLIALHRGKLLQRSRSVAHELGLWRVLVLLAGSRHGVELLRAADLVELHITRIASPSGWVSAQNCSCRPASRSAH